MHLVADEILAGLSLRPTEYAPILQKNYQGNFWYKQVTEYNSKWLKRTKEGLQKYQRFYVPFEPSQAWTEYRWIFVRRMAGDELCQNIFYQMSTFIWCANGIEPGIELIRYQYVLIEDVFGYENKIEFIKKENTPPRFQFGMGVIEDICRMRI